MYKGLFNLISLVKKVVQFWTVLKQISIEKYEKFDLKENLCYFSF